MVTARTNLDYHAVAASSGVVAAGQGVPSGMISLFVGLLGVALARWVFVNKEYRATNRPQKWNETLPLTLVAMLVAGVLIWDRKFSVSTSAFVGLGVGWTAVLLLDVLGDWILTKAKIMFSSGPADPNFPKKADLSGHDGRIIADDVNLPSDMVDKVVLLDKTPDPGDDS
jgi:hypothetical protein